MNFSNDYISGLKKIFRRASIDYRLQSGLGKSINYTLQQSGLAKSTYQIKYPRSSKSISVEEQKLWDDFFIQLENSLSGGAELDLQRISGGKDFLEKLINLSLELNPTYDQFKLAYGSILSHLSYTEVVKKIVDNEKYEFLWALIEGKDNIIHQSSLTYLIARIADTQFSDKVLDGLQPVICEMLSSNLLIEENQHYVIENIKKIFPSNKWSEFLPYLPLLPQKVEGSSPLFGTKKNSIVELTLEKQQIYNHYNTVVTSKDTTDMLHRVLSAISEHSLEGIEFISFKPTQDNGYLNLLVGSPNEVPVSLEKVKILLTGLFDVYNNLESSLSTDDKKDYLIKSVQACWLNATLDTKAMTKNKVKKI